MDYIDGVDEDYIMKSIEEVKARIKRRLVDNQDDEDILKCLHKVLKPTNSNVQGDKI